MQESKAQSSVSRGVIAAAVVLVSLIAVAIARAGVIEVDSFHVGAFYDLDATGAPLTPDNDMSFQNYFMGHTTVSGFTTTERRTFFSFDVASSPIPEDEIITSVELVLTLPFGGVIANMGGGFEEVLFTSTTSDYTTFADPLSSGLKLDEIFDSMGTGDIYAGFGIDGDTIDGEYSIDLSLDAIEDIGDSLGSGTPFMLTGRLATYDPDPGAAFEFVFGLTDVVVGGLPTGFPVPKLVITTEPIPAPASLSLLGLGLLVMSKRR
jgi:hypothetical protein